MQLFGVNMLENSVFISKIDKPQEHIQNCNRTKIIKAFFLNIFNLLS